MKKKKLQIFLKTNNLRKYSMDIVDNMLESLGLNCIAKKNLAMQLIKMPFLMKDAFYWYKFHLFISGISEGEKNLELGAKLSNKLFDTPENTKKNGMRLLEYINKADSEQKIGYYVNATKSLFIENIDIVSYFRIIKAISETLNEDLEYLENIAMQENEIKGNMQILALERSGLVIQASLSHRESTESQGYIISSLGRMVDCYAISFENNERITFYKNNKMKDYYFDSGLREISNEEIEEMFKKSEFN